ncbi:Gfo/Idh/MocA family oxidoreductase [Clostridia bacterium OttesenSCG-928-O13]|nr:Gfo/Idh/MocA family oxidoreductase [Clostridia bacterium OttesenSCG-928-O13]
MNVAIVGPGGIANTHAAALAQLKQNLVMVVGRDAAKAKAFAETWGAAASSTKLEDALGPGVDVVHLCTPPALHYAMAKDILAAGKHLVCEKPLTLSADEAKELVALAKEKKVLAAVNFNVRFHEACGRAKAAVADKSFGDVQLIHGTYFQEFHLLPADYMWRYIPQLGGKMRAVTEIGSHWIDLARFWTGLEINAVCATLGRFNPKRMLDGGMMYPEGHKGGEEVEVGSEDAAAVTFRFENGALGSMLLSEVSSGRSNYLSMEVSSGNAAVWWNSEDPYRLNEASGKFAGAKTTVNAFGGGFPDTFSAFFGKVYGALKAGQYEMDGADYPTLQDGFVNAAVCDAIWQSAHSKSAWTEVSY